MSSWAQLLELDWEVGVFKALRGLARWISPPAPTVDPARAATLDAHLQRLSVTAGLIAGEPVRLLPARDAGGARGADLLVPAAIDLLPDPEANRGLLLLRVMHTAMVRRIQRDDAVAVPASPEARLALELTWAVEAARRLAADLPAFDEAWREGCRACLAARPDPATLSPQAQVVEALRRRALAGELPGAFTLPADPFGARGGPSPSVPLWGAPIAEDGPLAAPGQPDLPSRRPTDTEHQAPPVEEVRRVTLSEKDREESVLQHTFEKVETAEAFNGRVRDADGEDELDDHLEALQEVDLGDMLRGGDEAHSVLRAELGGADVPDVEQTEPGEAGIPYDEWDGAARRYRPGWCMVYPSRFRARVDGWSAPALVRQRATIERIRRQIDEDRHRLRPQNRQRDGEQVDVDAVVDGLADRAAGLPLPERVYIRQQRALRDVALSVLLDLSLSADAWVSDRRVLDVCRDATLVLGELAWGMGDAFAVHGFASSTRNRCRVWALKGWHEDWPAVRDRLGAVEPQGYTRIGAALRHATADLARQPAHRRMLVLISDGRPTDYDRYEGRYGMADVRQALREAARLQVEARALAVDHAARDTLPAMFGPGGWELLPHPDALPAALGRLYGRFSSGR